MEASKAHTPVLFKNKIYDKVTDILFPVILVLFSFIGVNRGIDITDTGYNLGNYTFLSGLDGMWFYSTFLSNYVGKLIVSLPYGGTLLGANIYTGIIKASFGLVSYYFFTRKTHFTKEIVFTANFIAFGLWWIPNAGLYHYLSFYLLALGAVFVYIGLLDGKKKYLFIAGATLSLNIFVRFPNLTNMALILGVWYYSVLKKESFKECINKTLVCIAGYVSVLVLFFICFTIGGDTGDYIQGIKELFEMTDSAQNYGMRFMIVNLINSYTCVWYWMIPIVLGAVALILLGVLFEKLRLFGYVASVAGFLAIYFWELRTKLFDYVFTSYSSIYLFMVVILVINTLLLLFGLIYRGFSDELKMWCVLALLIQVVTPLGTNNSLYAVMNNLFFVLPVSLRVLTKMHDEKMLRYLSTGLWTFVLLFALQCVLFHSANVFRDGYLGPLDSYVYNNPRLSNMKTESANAVRLTELSDLWEDKELSECEIITFGDLPGLAYVMDTRPAVSSTWVTLDSYSSKKFEDQMNNVCGRIDNKGLKVVVATDHNLELDGRKQEILKDFLQKYGFISIYDKNDLKIWIIEEDKK